MREIIKLSLKVFILITAAYLVGCGGRDIVYDQKGYPLHGKKIIFNQPMSYFSGLLERAYNPEVIKYNAYITRKSAVGYENTAFYKEVSDIEAGTIFTVSNSFRNIPWGLQKSFSNEVRTLVLSDASGKKYTIASFEVDADEWQTEH